VTLMVQNLKEFTEDFSYAVRFAERVTRARVARQAAQNAFRFSFLRCTYAGRWVAADWNPSHPLPRKLAGFRP